MRTSEQWDRVYTVMNMAADDGNLPDYFSGPECTECGSQFLEHRCHMQEAR